MTTNAFVLLSGGIDSSTCLAIANEEFSQVEGVSVDYGQRHAKELEVDISALLREKEDIEAWAAMGSA